MTSHSETIKSLNKLLTGEYMATESFNNFISKTDNENTRVSLQDIQKQHRNNIEILASYIQDIGGQPHENIGMKGKMADLKLNMELGSKVKPNRLIHRAIKGETRGINMAEKILRGQLDDKSREVAGIILQNDRHSIDKLRQLI